MPRHITAEQKQQIYDGFFQGLTYAEIAEKVGVSPKVVYVHVARGKEEGILPAGWTKHEHKKRRKVVTPFNMNKRPKKLPEAEPDGITVNCTRAVSKKCVYGCSAESSPTINLCNYILCEGHSRGCPPEACTKFSKKGPGNPQRMSHY